VSPSSRLLRASLKEGRTTTLKFLIACALITAISETAVAQTIPEKCQKLLIDHYQFVQDKNGTWFLYALVHNEDPYNVSSAVFSFDLLVGENFKVGYGSAYIQRLMHGNTERVPITYTTDEDIKDYITTNAIGINHVSSSCSFTP
jgi:hypothetical protein